MKLVVRIISDNSRNERHAPSTIDSLAGAEWKGVCGRAPSGCENDHSTTQIFTSNGGKRAAAKPKKITERPPWMSSQGVTLFLSFSCPKSIRGLFFRPGSGRSDNASRPFNQLGDRRFSTCENLHNNKNNNQRPASSSQSTKMAVAAAE